VDYELRDTVEQWPIEETTELAEGKITSYVRDSVRMTDGSVAGREYLMHPGAVAVVVLDDQDHVLGLRQYRHPVRRIMWELPAGLLDQPGEHPLAAAQRELYEEAHLKAADWRVLVDYYNSPGSSAEAIRVFLARGPADADGERFVGHAEEADIVAHWVPRTALVDAVLAGDVGNASLVAGMLAVTAALTRPGGLESLRPADAPWEARPYQSAGGTRPGRA